MDKDMQENDPSMEENDPSMEENDPSMQKEKETEADEVDLDFNLDQFEKLDEVESDEDLQDKSAGIENDSSSGLGVFGAFSKPTKNRIAMIGVHNKDPVQLVIVCPTKTKAESLFLQLQKTKKKVISLQIDRLIASVSGDEMNGKMVRKYMITQEQFEFPPKFRDFTLAEQTDYVNAWRLSEVPEDAYFLNGTILNSIYYQGRANDDGHTAKYNNMTRKIPVYDTEAEEFRGFMTVTEKFWSADDEQYTSALQGKTNLPIVCATLGMEAKHTPRGILLGTSDESFIFQEQDGIRILLPEKDIPFNEASHVDAPFLNDSLFSSAKPVSCFDDIGDNEICVIVVEIEDVRQEDATVAQRICGNTVGIGSTCNTIVKRDRKSGELTCSPYDGSRYPSCGTIDKREEPVLIPPSKVVMLKDKEGKRIIVPVHGNQPAGLTKIDYQGKVKTYQARGFEKAYEKVNKESVKSLKGRLAFLKLSKSTNTHGEEEFWIATVIPLMPRRALPLEQQQRWMSGSAMINYEKYLGSQRPCKVPADIFGSRERANAAFMKGTKRKAKKGWERFSTKRKRQ